MVSHDRHMLELTADRLILVDEGRANEYSGTLDDYTDMVLGRNQKSAKNSEKPTSNGNRKEERRASAEKRKLSATLRKAIMVQEKKMDIISSEISALDRAMFDPSQAKKAYSDLGMSDLMKMRSDKQDMLDKCEAEWLKTSDKLESL